MAQLTSGEASAAAGRESSIDVRVLGPLEVLESGRPIDIGAGKQRVLLALLALRAGEVVSTDRLIDALWGEQPPASALNSVHVYVSQLRKALGADRVETRGRGYVLVLGSDELDLGRCERLLGEGRRLLAAGEDEPAAQALHAAVALWRGPPLADLASEAALQVEIARLDELRLAAVEEQVEADLRLGRHAELVPELEALVREHPLRERLRAELMLALYRSGRQSDALEAYRQARTLLATELGLEPGRALQELERAILRQDAELDPPGLAVARADRGRRLGAIGAAAAAAALLVAAAAAAVGVALSRGNTAPVVVGNSVVRIDASTLEPTDVVPVGDMPDLIVVAGGFVWVTHHVLRDVDSGALRDAGDRTLTRVDPSTGEAEVVGGGLAPCGIAADPSGDVWVANCYAVRSGAAATVVRIDAATLRFEATWRVPGGDGFFRGLTYGDGSLWVSDVRGADVLPKRHWIYRINPRTGARQSIPVPDPAGPLAWSDDYGDLWMSNFPARSVSRLDPSTPVVRTRSLAPAGPAFLAADLDLVWIPDWHSPRILRVRAVGPMRPHSVTLPVRASVGVWTVAAEDGTVWATTPRASVVWRIDAATNEVTRVPIPHLLPAGVAIVDGGVWISVRTK